MNELNREQKNFFDEKTNDPRVLRKVIRAIAYFAVVNLDPELDEIVSGYDDEEGENLSDAYNQGFNDGCVAKGLAYEMVLDELQKPEAWLKAMEEIHDPIERMRAASTSAGEDTKMKKLYISSKERWTDGSPVLWKVRVREVPMDAATNEEWYDRDAKTNREVTADGGILRVFFVEEIIDSPDSSRAQEEGEPISANEFLAVKVGDKLVVLMNHKEYAEKIYGNLTRDFDENPTLINIQDCGFNVGIEEEE